jgi:hypothetical protein
MKPLILLLALTLVGCAHYEYSFNNQKLQESFK